MFSHTKTPNLRGGCFRAGASDAIAKGLALDPANKPLLDLRAELEDLTTPLLRE